jgi:hypothetical protein
MRRGSVKERGDYTTETRRSRRRREDEGRGVNADVGMTLTTGCRVRSTEYRVLTAVCFLFLRDFHVSAVVPL